MRLTCLIWNDHESHFRELFSSKVSSLRALRIFLGFGYLSERYDSGLFKHRLHARTNASRSYDVRCLGGRREWWHNCLATPRMNQQQKAPKIHTTSAQNWIKVVGGAQSFFEQFISVSLLVLVWFDSVSSLKLNGEWQVFVDDEDRWEIVLDFQSNFPSSSPVLSSKVFYSIFYWNPSRDIHDHWSEENRSSQRPYQENWLWKNA